MDFHSFTLKNNLQVLAISDSRFVKSSAALAVRAGSMQNPDEHLGLAHFLEHMLFLGTESYPEVGNYEDFLNKHGGGHNAYTSIDHTNYFFDVAHSGYEGALQRFSRFFVCPTFDEKFVEREINAVHSEHEKNLKDDSRREYRFLQMITDPKHPFSKFATGDKNTLAHANREVVKAFYDENYSANLMRLVLMSPLSGQELQKLAEQYFSDILDKELPIPHFDDELFVDPDLPKLHKVETVRDQDILKISFDLPDDFPYWESKPTQFLAHIIGEEGEGSLLSYLKKHSLALGLETSTWWRMFHVRIHLTENGKKNWEDVLRATFSFIELVKKEGLKKHIFDERKVLAEIELENIEPKSSMSRASQFSASMLYFPVDKFLDHYYLYHKHSDEEFHQFLSYLQVHNMQVTVLARGDFKEKKEPYYGIEYCSETLDENLVLELQRMPVYGDFRYPEQNPYLPTHLQLQTDKPLQGKPKSEIYGDYARIYSMVDTELKIPKASMSVSFISDQIAGDPRRFLLAKMFAKLKREELNEWGYPAKLAGLNYGISHGYNTITLDVSGYSQHLSHLLNDLIYDSKHNRQLNHIEMDQKTFERVRVRMKKELLNRQHDAAYQQLLYEMGHFFSSAGVHFNQYIDVVDEITLDEVNAFARDFFSSVAIRTFSYGNITGNEVKPVIDNFFQRYKAKGFTEKQVEAFENKFLKLPEGQFVFSKKGDNNNNAELTLYQFAPWNIKNQAHMEIIGKLVEQPFFTELRTHQQLGYVVAAFSSSSNGFCGLGTLIQSQSHEAIDIFNRSHEFLKKHLRKLVDSVTAEDVDAIKSSLISEISLKPSSLGERLSRFTTMAGQYHGDFAFLDKLVGELSLITKSDLVEFIKKEIVEKLSDNPTLCLLYNGGDAKTSDTPQGFEVIENYKDFVNSLERIQPYKESFKHSTQAVENSVDKLS